VIPIQRLRDEPEVIREGARRKGIDAPVDEILELDARARALRTEMEERRAEQNAATRAIKGRPSDAERERLAALRQRIQELETEVSQLEAERDSLLLLLPNPPVPTVPHGKGPDDSVTVREWGEAQRFPFSPRAHWDIGDGLGIFDSERGAKLSGARFMVLRGEGARLQRALVGFFLDAALRSGHVEVAPPHLVRRECMVGTGQLPKFEDDAFRTDDDLFLIPTAEVPVTNLYRDEILEPGTLPIRHVAWTQCFRREAGSAGKDTRGFIRLHQFEKVELVRIVEPEQSDAELEQLTAEAEALLQTLGLRYRVLLLCDADMGFTQAKTYDLEVWAPAMGRWLEASSCSDFGDFQARRAGIRYRSAAQQRPRYPHTLNGSALALPRVISALLETYQEADGSVIVPQVLRPYMAGIERLHPRA
jgi:seryl-tRNA synthetase